MIPLWLRLKVYHYSQVARRFLSLTIIGVTLILASHFISTPDEREWLRDAGSGIIAYAFAKWLSEQGKRRLKDDGSKVRKDTIEIKARDVNRIDNYFRGKKR